MNGVRGETVLTVNGAPRRLCLTLGALAELETAFSVNGLEALAERLARPTSDDLIHILTALLRGGGEDVALNDVRSAQVDLGEAVTAIGAAFQALNDV